MFGALAKQRQIKDHEDYHRRLTLEAAIDKDDLEYTSPSEDDACVPDAVMDRIEKASNDALVGRDLSKITDEDLDEIGDKMADAIDF